MDGYCLYYQAYVPPVKGWYVVAILKSYDHIALARTVDVKNSVWEFYVPHAMEQSFLQIMAALAKEGAIERVQKLPNRLADPAQHL